MYYNYVIPQKMLLATKNALFDIPFAQLYFVSECTEYFLNMCTSFTSVEIALLHSYS